MVLSPTDEPALDAPVPTWFSGAVSRALTSHFVEYDGCRLHYLDWGRPAEREAPTPALMFLHGGGAHANWWRFIAPFFADTFHVIAPDLSGMGDSGRREHYDSAVRAAELDAVARAAGLYEGLPPIVIGHSFGGFTGIRFASDFGDALGGFVMIDTPIRPPADEARHFAERPERDAAARRYDAYDDALVRFRLRPKQTCRNAFAVEFIARHSITQTPNGWTWKFDPQALSKNRHAEPFPDYLASIRTPVALLYGERSALTTQPVIRHMQSLVSQPMPAIGIPQAQHHVLLDEPLALVAALRGLLGGWAVSGVLRR